MASITRTQPLRPHACYDKKTGDGIDLQSILKRFTLMPNCVPQKHTSTSPPKTWNAFLNTTGSLRVMLGKRWVLNYTPNVPPPAGHPSNKWYRIML